MVFDDLSILDFPISFPTRLSVPAGRYDSIPVDGSELRAIGKYYCCMAGCSQKREGSLEVLWNCITPKEAFSKSSVDYCYELKKKTKQNKKATTYIRVCSESIKISIGPTYFDRDMFSIEYLTHKRKTEKPARKAPKGRTLTSIYIYIYI